MKKFTNFILFVVISLSFSTFAQDRNTHETDSLYQTLIKSVEQSDFDLMASTYHQDAVLVTAKKTSSIASALKRWKKDGEKLTKEGGRATLAFRFSKRMINGDTAFETGIYRYSTIDKSGKETVFFAHFEDLNIKKNGQWLTIMENQTAKATQAEWDQLSG